MTSGGRRGQEGRDSLVRTILDQIFQGKLHAGERLPSIEELGRRHGMSIVSVREAIQKLSLMGLVHIRQGGGTFLDENIPSIIEILDARKYVEMATCLLAARNATDEEHRELDALIVRDGGRFPARRLRSPSRRRTSRSTCPSARMSRNVLLSAFLENIQDLLYYLQQRTHMLQGTIEQANRFHPLIAEAIKEPGRERRPGPHRGAYRGGQAGLGGIRPDPGKQGTAGGRDSSPNSVEPHPKGGVKRP